MMCEVECGFLKDTDAVSKAVDWAAFEGWVEATRARGGGRFEASNPRGAVATMPLLTRAACAALCDALSALGAAQRRTPTAHHGDAIAALGLTPLFSALVRRCASPAAAAFFGRSLLPCGALDDEDFLAGTCPWTPGASAEPPHDDESVVTMTIVLNDGFEGGAVQYHSGDYAWEVAPPAGHALLHAGDMVHNALPVTSGQRFSVVVWMLPRTAAAGRKEAPSFYTSVVRPYLEAALAHVGQQHHHAFVIPRLPGWATKLLQRAGATAFLKAPSPMDEQERSVDPETASWWLSQALGMLSRRDLLACALVCKQWYQLARSLLRAGLVQSSRPPPPPSPAAADLTSIASGGFRAVVSLHVGGCGSRLGAMCWNKFFLEGMPGGARTSETPDEFLRWVEETRSGYVPRSVFACADEHALQYSAGWASPVGNVPAGAKVLLPRETCAWEQAFARQAAERVVESYRRCAERCSSVGSMLVTSGLGAMPAAFFSHMLEDYDRKDFPRDALATVIQPFSSPLFEADPFGPANEIISFMAIRELFDVVLHMDNQRLASIWERLGVGMPSFEQLNALASRVLVDETCSMRLGGAFMDTMSELIGSNVPYPTINVLLSSLSPLLLQQPPADAAPRAPSATEITTETLMRQNWTSSVDPRLGKYMSLSLLYRGDIVPKDVMAAVGYVKTQRCIEFVDWCPTGFRTGIMYNSQPQSTIPGDLLCTSPRSCTAFANSTAVGSVFQRMADRAEALASSPPFFPAAEAVVAPIEFARSIALDHIEIESPSTEEEDQDEEY